jgi:hypothetical protein
MLAQEAKQQQIMREAFRAQMLSMLASKTYRMNDFVREMKVAYLLCSFQLVHLCFSSAVGVVFVSHSNLAFMRNAARMWCVHLYRTR